jgi:AAA domain
MNEAMLDANERMEIDKRAQRTSAAGVPSESVSVESEVPYLQVSCADTHTVKRVEWLSFGRIPFGGLTLCDGPGGVGKTTFLTGIIAAATRGLDFFTGEKISPRNALIVGVEDSRSLIVARLRLYKAEMKHIYFVDATHIAGRDVPLVLPDHLGVLERKIIDLEIGIVYIDALFSHLAIEGGGKMPHQVRAALHPIGEMCERRNIVFAAVRHWTKTAGSARDRAIGSIEFTDYARSVFTFGEHPNNDKLVVCAQTKTNYQKKAEPIAFSIVGHDVSDDSGESWNVSIAEGVVPCEGVTSDDLTMRVSLDPDDKTVAGEWLKDYLADGKDHLAEKVYEAATGARLGSRSTIRRAAKSIGVVMGRTGFPSVGTWQLPITGASEDQSRHSGVISIYKTPLEKSPTNDVQKTLTGQCSSSHVTVVSTVKSPSGHDAADATVGELQERPLGVAEINLW